MKRTRMIFKVIGLSTVVWGNQVAAAEKLSDSEVRQHMVGSWIIPPDSADYSPSMAQTLETYYPDGSETLLLFRDRNCQTVGQTLSAKWNVKDGVLITISPDGQEDFDDVIDITERIAIFRSHSDGTSYSRVRATNCGNIAS